MKFKKVEEIGEGGFGKVFKVQKKKNSKPFAVKVVRMHVKATDSLNEVKQHHVYREVQAMQRLDSVSTVKLFDTWFEELSSSEQQTEIQYKQKYTQILLDHENQKQGKKQLSECSLSSSSSGFQDSTYSAESLFQCEGFDDFQCDDVNTTCSVSEDSSEYSCANSSLSDIPSEFSKQTINDYLKEGTPFYTINLMIRMEYCNSATLQDYLKNRNSKSGQGFVTQKDTNGIIDRQYNLRVMKQMVQGLNDVHAKNVLHRDLKPENIFLNDDGKRNTSVKIGDFGLSLLEENMSEISSVAGTQDYMAPEIKKHFNNGTKPHVSQDIVTLQSQDVYQLGLIFYELSHKIRTNMQKTRDFRDLAVNRRICSQCPLGPTDIEYKLIMRMTEQDPKNRPNAQEILNEWLPLLEHELKLVQQPLLRRSSIKIPREISRMLTILVLFHKTNKSVFNTKFKI